MSELGRICEGLLKKNLKIALTLEPVEFTINNRSLQSAETLGTMANERYSKTTYLALCGLFAALMAICSFITIPLGFTPVPVNLGTLGVFLAGGILGRKYGTISIAVYVLLGAVGVPVFAGLRGGLGVLAGPTGGYIIGYIVAAFLAGQEKIPLRDLKRSHLKACSLFRGCWDCRFFCPQTT